MVEFLSSQMDFVAGMGVVAFVLIAMAAWGLRKSKLNLRWLCLAAYAVASAVMAVLVLTLGPTGSERSLVVDALAVLLRALAGLALLEFARVSGPQVGLRRLGAWVLPALLVVSGVGAAQGLRMFDATVALTLGVTSHIWAAMVFYRSALLSRRDFSPGASWWALTSAGFAVLSVPIFCEALAVVIPEFAVAFEWFGSGAMGPIQVGTTGAATVLSITLWTAGKKVRSAGLPAESKSVLRMASLLASALLVVVVGVGWYVAWLVGNSADQDQKQRVIELARLFAGQGDEKAIGSFSGTRDDIQRVGWQDFRKRCQRMGESSDSVRYVYMFRMATDGRLRFVVDTEPARYRRIHPEDQPTATPGEPYVSPEGAFFESVFEDRSAKAFGPYTDKWGSFLSGAAPVIDYDTNEVVAVLGVDVDASHWYSTIKNKRLPPILLTIVSAIFIAFGFVAYQRSSEDKLKIEASKKSLRDVFDHVQDAVLVLSPAGHIVETNHRAEQMFALDKQSLLGRSMLEAFAASTDSADTLKKVLDAVLGGDQVLLEWEAVDSKKRKFECEIHMSSMDLSGRLVAVATVRDLTSKRATQAQLKTALQRAEQLATRADAASRAKSDFLASMSHEIRTPLAGVIGMTTLLDDTELSDEQREYVNIIRQSGEVLLRVVTDVLDFSKMEAGKLQLERVSFDPVALVEDVVALLSPKACEKSLPLVSWIEPGVPRGVMGDPLRVKQILTNLVSNGIKFTDKGSVVVKITTVKSDKPGLALLELEVADTGVGIPAAKLPGLFQPFVQVDGSASRRFGGTGLGLTVSRRLVEMMGGSIRVASREGIGSRFTVRVPFELSAAPEKTALMVTRPTRVAVIDEDSNTRREIELMLDAIGASWVETASGGGQGSNTWLFWPTDSPPPDCVVVSSRISATVLDDLRRVLLALPEPRRPRTVWVSCPKTSPNPPDEFPVSARVQRPVRRLALLRAVCPVQNGEEGAGAAGSAETVPRPAGFDLLHETSEQAFSMANLPPVLVVDDNDTGRKVAVGLLNRLGRQAVAVSSGREAITALAGFRFSMVLLDCQMPDLDGYETCRRIRGAAEGVLDPSIPIVALTAHAFPGERERCVASGMDDFLSKPVRPEELERVVKRWTGVTSGATPNDGVPILEPRVAPDSGVFDAHDVTDRLAGDARLVDKVLTACLRELPERFDALDLAIEDSDAHMTRLHAHSIKGIAATMGAPRLRDIALQAETSAMDGDMSRCRTLHAALTSHFKDVSMEIKTFLDNIRV